MKSTVVPIRGELPDPLAELNAERERLGHELQRFAIVDEHRNAAEAKIAEVDRALAHLDGAERQAIEAWAETVEGEPPAPRLEERKSLLERRLDAEAERQAAEVAVAAVEPKRLGLIREMNAVGVRIGERKVAAALDEGRQVYAEAKTLARDIGLRMMRLEGLRLTLANAQAQAAGRRDDAQESIFRAALSELEAMRPPEVLADPTTVARFTAEWKEALR